jgi:hypothetical protein
MVVVVKSLRISLFLIAGQGLLTRSVDPATRVKSNRRLDKTNETNGVHPVATILFFHMREYCT